MHSVTITTDVVSSNLDQGKVYHIMWYSLLVTYDRSVVFSGSLSTIKQTNIHSIMQYYKTIELHDIVSHWTISDLFLAVGEIPAKFINLPANRFLHPVQWCHTNTNMADENDSGSVNMTNFADITNQQNIL